MIIMVFYYIEMIIERTIILARFILLKQDTQSQCGVGWLPSELWPDLKVIVIQKTYCETF
jgi:hypothetical protein